MSEQQPSVQGASPLGKASLGLGIASTSLVFGIGFCALVGVQQGWVSIAGTPLYICGASSAFLGFIGAIIGAGALFDRQHTRSLPVVGLVLGLMGVCLFFAFLASVGGG